MTMLDVSLSVTVNETAKHGGPKLHIFSAPH